MGEEMLTKERENQIKEILKHFPTIQAEKRLDTRKPAEVVDVKPIIKGLLGEVEALRTLLAEEKAELENINWKYSIVIEESNAKSEILNVAKETLALIAEGEGSDESVYMTMGKAALAKIEELEK
jgi:hypothetical protein